ncbi:DUF5107 domain-containing protein [Paenibacillus thiaminolyticus]|uniref:DUF5107 domain-containing protein n=1 Tax=Paenibacillus thiaminolyticus TaxID=49283 RepID=A0A3A3H6E4_PANTH|nr:DUF5107 domain-containing protein [Paenibacillus thiaminolyticus]RJG25270.1 DUF5107 domain-containing protein [Paenibacillus thiaminolyticus]
MLNISAWQETMLHHVVQPCGPVPTVADEEGIYPYVSYCETAKRPDLRKFRMIAIENEWIKLTVCPDLGGKVHSLIDKSTGKEILFQSGVVRPVRILPRMAFISGGIEVSFPIAHTPVLTETVHAHAKQVGERIYIWCGEQEIRYGMQWTVEYSLGAEERYVTQRMLLYNPTAQAHSWMSWSNAALPARPDSQFHFPAGKVLRHADTLEEIEWDAKREYRLADYDRMQGFFWRTADCHAFGMYTPSLGAGLYHIADPADTPGIKLWIYGIGPHEEWAELSAARRESYVEIQAGPLVEQSENEKLRPGERHLHTQYWIPSSEPLDIRQLQLPKPELMEAEHIPLFNWAPHTMSAPWSKLAEAYQHGTADQIPWPPAAEECLWPPSGMEQLGDAMKWAAEHGDEEARAQWRYYLGVWLAGRGDIDKCINVLKTVETDWSYAFLGRLLRVSKQDYAASREAFRKITCPAWSLHPQVFIERDITLHHIGSSALEEREQWFEQVNSLLDDGLMERQAWFLYDKGALDEAKAILEQHPFEKVHQRYKRSELWKLIVQALHSTEAQVPDYLGEDDLATYGAYRVSEGRS